MKQILFFTNSVSCAACTTMKEKLDGTAIMDVIDVRDIATDDNAIKLANEFRIRSLPAFVAINNSSRRIVGTCEISEIESLIGD